MKIPSTKFHRNLSGGIALFHADRQIGLTKPVFNYSLCKLFWKRWTAITVDFPWTMYTGPTKLLADRQKDVSQEVLEKCIKWKKKKTFHFDIHRSVHRRWLSRNTNKIELCSRIYYSRVYWRLNMFRAAHRLSSEALNCICSLWVIYPCGDRPLPRLSRKIPLSLDNGRSAHAYINQRLQIQFRAPDDERCAARNMLSLQ